MMTTRERMLAVYEHRMPDKFPLGIYGRYLPRGEIDRKLREKGLGIIDYHPLVTFLGPPWHELPGYISDVTDTQVRIDRYFERGRMVQRTTYETPVGSIWREKEPSIGDGSEHVRNYFIKNLEDYKIMTYIIEHTVISSNEGAIAARRAALGEDGVLLGRLDRSPYQKLLLEFVGAERFLVDLFEEPEAVEGLMDVMYSRLEESCEKALSTEALLVWQPDNVTADMTPPKYFEKYLLPYYKKLSARLHGAGKKLVAHLDGKVRALRELIPESGIDVLDSLSFPDIGGDMTLQEAREAFPGISVLPNFPSNLSPASEEEIRGFLRNLKAIAGTEEPFMLQISEDLQDGSWPRVLPNIADEMLAD
jgi:uroporphyrinogen-III decarboxylase